MGWAGLGRGEGRGGVTDRDHIGNIAEAEDIVAGGDYGEFLLCMADLAATIEECEEIWSVIDHEGRVGKTKGADRGWVPE